MADGKLLYAEATYTDSRYETNYFIYDLNTGEFLPLRSSESPSTNAFTVHNEICSAEMLRSRTAVSMDGKCFALLVHGNIYLYDTYGKDGLLRILPVKASCRTGYISFCHRDNNTLTLVNENLYQLNIQNGDILYQRSVSTQGNKKYICATANHLVFETVNGLSTSISLLFENTYTGIDVFLQLSSKNSLIDTYINDSLHMLYTLHDNGTVLFWDADTLSLINCYNFAVDRHILLADYSEKYSVLCFASRPRHSSLYSHII